MTGGSACGSALTPQRWLRLSSCSCFRRRLRGHVARQVGPAGRHGWQPRRVLAPLLLSASLRGRVRSQRRRALMIRMPSWAQRFSTTSLMTTPDRRHHQGSERDCGRDRGQGIYRCCPHQRGSGAEHYEINRYGTLVAWAKRLGRADCASVLQQTLDEEKATDQKLTKLAESKFAKAASPGFDKLNRLARTDVRVKRRCYRLGCSFSSGSKAIERAS